jgi:hypothetical protein
LALTEGGDVYSWGCNEQVLLLVFPVLIHNGNSITGAAWYFGTKAVSDLHVQLIATTTQVRIPELYLFNMQQR